VADISSIVDDQSDWRLNWLGLSQAERDAAYDNNKAVEDGPALIAERNKTSAALRAARASALDVPYIAPQTIERVR
jgi:arylformamidase